MLYINELKKLYKNEPEKIIRFEKLINQFEQKFKNSDYELFTSSGRTEIIGNHTDHNFGKVVCASINLDTVAVASKNNDNKIHIISIDYKEDYIIDLNNLIPNSNDTWSCLLIKGMLVALKKIANIGGANILITSDVISSAGVSSSASFEMLIATIMNSFYNNDSIDIVKLAKTGQFAENNYWNKKSGLLDQIACAYGGMIAIDFKDINNPTITKLNSTDLEENYDLIIVPTGSGHADLSEEYSSIPNEMKSIANTELRNIDKNYIIKNYKELRNKLSDRALLRAIHFFDENERVDKIISALENKDYNSFLNIVKSSGNSSFKYLQNCYVNSLPEKQPIPLLLVLTEDYIIENKIKASVRVHGGGFAGVIMVVMPKQDSDKYIDYISQFVDDKIHKVNIRPYGAINIKNIK